jgi:hypothetical protein
MLAKSWKTFYKKLFLNQNNDDNTQTKNNKKGDLDDFKVTVFRSAYVFSPFCVGPGHRTAAVCQRGGGADGGLTSSARGPD